MTCALCGQLLPPCTQVLRAGVEGPTCGRGDLCAQRAGALAFELRAALADQRDRGASSHEVAGRVRAVADALEAGGAVEGAEVGE